MLEDEDDDDDVAELRFLSPPLSVRPVRAVTDR